MEEGDQRKIVVLFDREPMEISTDVMPLLRLSQLARHPPLFFIFRFSFRSKRQVIEGAAKGMGFFSRV